MQIRKWVAERTSEAEFFKMTRKDREQKYGDKVRETETELMK